MENAISFPGLGINELHINKIALQIGNITVTWYGIIITVGIVLAVLYVFRRAQRLGIDGDTILDIAIPTVICGVIGARIYYVLTTLGEGRYHSFYDVIALWNGGLAIYGAVIGGGLAVFVMCRIKKIRFLSLADVVAPAVMIGQIIGRWGNFANAEAYGSLTQYSFFHWTFDTTDLFSNLFCRMGIERMDGSFLYVHPTFLYESIWNLIGFLLLHAAWKHRRRDGQIFWGYLAWYGFGRMLIEGLRTDSLYVGTIRISQLVGLLCFLCGLVMWIYCHVSPRPLWHMPVLAKKADDTDVGSAVVDKTEPSISPTTDMGDADNVNTEETCTHDDKSDACTTQHTSDDADQKK